MSPVFRIARTEILEQQRQPWMIFILGANYLLWIGIFGGAFLVVGTASGAALEELRRQMATAGVALDAFLQFMASSFGSLVFTNLPLYVAITSGTSVLHDRESGTMPFLMLAPVTRLQLLTGKLLGALAIPLLCHLVLVGGSSLILGQLPSMAPYADRLGGSAAWWVAFLVGAPASALFVGALGTVISALSRDVRTSMQYTSFFVGILSLGIGYALVDEIPAGAAMQVMFASACTVAAVAILFLGARLISRDGMAT